MHSGKKVIKHLLQFLARYEFNLCVSRYCGEHWVKKFPSYDQFLSLAYAQMSGRESLRDIETCLNSYQEKLYHIEFRSDASRTTLIDTNERRDWLIFQESSHVLISMAQRLYQREAVAIELQQPLYVFDSTTIDPCLSLFPWAEFRKTRAAVKMPTLIDLSGPVPNWVAIPPRQSPRCQTA